MDQTPSQPIRISAVEFVNTRPLIAGLYDDQNVRLTLAVPSKLVEHLQNGQADVALLPVIDILKIPGLQIIPAGGICSDGETLTVRIFSRQPIETIRRLACDTDSHTSVALARVIFERAYGLRPEFVPLPSAREDDPRLLIGDKVICESPSGFPIQLDLGAAWKKLTGLPFVFAVWVGTPSVNIDQIASILSRSREFGMTEMEDILTRYAIPRGWPADIARKYLTQHLHFAIGPREIEAIKLFHSYAS